MPTIKRLVAASVADALTGLKFKVWATPAIVSLAASGATVGDALDFSVGSDLVVDAAQLNLEAANQVVSMDRDIILAQERVKRGEYFLPMTGTADMSFALVIDPLRR